MNKSALIESIAFNAGISVEQAGKALNAMTGSITKSLKKGENVMLLGFGTFKVTKRSARMGRDPRTGKEIKISARNVLGFSAGKGLKEAVN
ncbi:MAG TPA: HU family DNA-binding protein [Methylophilaceae bacterium]|jgi:DNA-binding protein HU-beta